MLLVSNSCLTSLIYGCVLLSKSFFTLQNDLQQIYFQDSFCYFRGYLAYSSCAVLGYSFVLQAEYRYVLVIYPARLFLQSFRFQLFLIFLTWLFSFGHTLAFLFNGDIAYNTDNQICQVPFRVSPPILYGSFTIYLIPVWTIMFIYLKLVRYVRKISEQVTPVNILSRAKRELKMIQRIVIIISILLTLGVPYMLFLFISFFILPPKYHFRIAYIFVDTSLLLVVMALFQFTDLLKTAIMNRIRGRSNTIVVIMA